MWKKWDAIDFIGRNKNLNKTVRLQSTWINGLSSFLDKISNRYFCMNKKNLSYFYKRDLQFIVVDKSNLNERWMFWNYSKIDTAHRELKNDISFVNEVFRYTGESSIDRIKCIVLVRQCTFNIQFVNMTKKPFSKLSEYSIFNNIPKPSPYTYFTKWH